MASPIRERLLESTINQLLQPALKMGQYANSKWEGSLEKVGDQVSVCEPSSFELTAYTGAAITPHVNNPKAMTIEITDRAAFNEFAEKHTLGSKITQYVTELGRMGANAIAAAVEASLIANYADCGIQDATDLGTNAAAITITNATPATAKANTENLIKKIWRYFEDAGVQPNDRVVFVPTWVAEIIMDAETGIIPRYAGMEIVAVPLLPGNTALGASDADGIIMAGIKNKSFAYAAKIETVSMYKPEGMNGLTVEGFVLYGSKIMRPDMTLLSYVD